MRRVAVFLDRDGTLVEDRGDLGSPDQVVFFCDTVPALRELGRDFLLFIVTHQPGIAAGRLTESQVSLVNQHVVDELGRSGVKIAGVYLCPHRRTDGCDCIKPEPRLVEQAAREHGVDLGRSYVVGDHPHDLELARRVGATGIYVLSGHGLRHRSELRPGSPVVSGIRAAARVILDEHQGVGDDPVGRAAQALRRGELVAFPTETVYGLGASALDARAAARIFEAKRRPAFDPLIVHVAEREAVAELAIEVPPDAAQLIAHFWPGPLTLVLKKREFVPDLVTAGLPTVALRMPDHPLAEELLRRAAVPVCAPSANPFGYVSPTTAEHVAEQLGSEVTAILDGGPCRVGIESTILAWTGGDPIVLRPGGTPLERIEALLGRKVPVAGTNHPVSGPGMLSRHYSPAVPLATFRGEVPPPPTARAGLILLAPRPIPAGYAAVELLSRDGNLAEVAQNLFSALRRVDQASLDCALAELAPGEGLGLAINDRLGRAAQRPEGAQGR